MGLDRLAPLLEQEDGCPKGGSGQARIMLILKRPPCYIGGRCKTLKSIVGAVMTAPAEQKGSTCLEKSLSATC